MQFVMSLNKLQVKKNVSSLISMNKMPFAIATLSVNRLAHIGIIIVNMT